MMDSSPVVVYWRPGCPFCLSLRQALLAARIPVTWRNIWADPSAAEFVRSVADGNETVPTVVLDGRSMVNPRPATLLTEIRDAHPDLELWPSRWAAWRDFRRNRR